MPHQTLDITDAAELAELLQFLRDWLTDDHDQLAESPDPLRREPPL